MSKPSTSHEHLVDLRDEDTRGLSRREGGVKLGMVRHLRLRRMMSSSR